MKNYRAKVRAWKLWAQCHQIPALNVQCNSSLYLRLCLQLTYFHTLVVRESDTGKGKNPFLMKLGN